MVLLGLYVCLLMTYKIYEYCHFLIKFYEFL